MKEGYRTFIKALLAERDMTATVIIYNEESYEEVHNVPLERIGYLRQEGKVLWARVNSKLNEDLLMRLSNWIDLDAIDMRTILEDHKGNPRLIEFEKCSSVPWRYVEKVNHGVEKREVYLLVSAGYLVSFEEVLEDKERARELLMRGTKIRREPVGYLLYTILDITMNDFFNFITSIGTRIDEIQEEIINLSSPQVDEVLDLRKDLISLWESIWDLRDIASSLYERHARREEQSLVNDFHDLMNRIDRLSEIVNSTRMIIPQVISLYENDLSNELNKIVRILTVITVIFTPIAIIPTWYGMNFQYMPELGNAYGYIGVTLVTILIGVVLTLYFWKKKWFNF